MPMMLNLVYDTGRNRTDDITFIHRFQEVKMLIFMMLVQVNSNIEYSILQYNCHTSITVQSCVKACEWGLLGCHQERNDSSIEDHGLLIILIIGRPILLTETKQ